MATMTKVSRQPRASREAWTMGGHSAPAKIGPGHHDGDGEPAQPGEPVRDVGGQRGEHGRECRRGRRARRATRRTARTRCANRPRKPSLRAARSSPTRIGTKRPNRSAKPPHRHAADPGSGHEHHVGHRRRTPRLTPNSKRDGLEGDHHHREYITERRRASRCSKRREEADDGIDATAPCPAACGRSRSCIVRAAAAHSLKGVRRGTVA